MWRTGLFSVKKQGNLKLFSSITTTTTTTKKGFFFEKQTLEILKFVGFELFHNGGAYDQGVDLQGKWNLPSCSYSVICQCKTIKRQVGPKYLREFAGTLQHFNCKTPTIGIFSSSSGYSIEAQRYFKKMSSPTILVSLHHQDIVGFMVNDALHQLIPNFTIGSQYINGQHKLSLLFDGCPIYVSNHHHTNTRNTKDVVENISLPLNDKKDEVSKKMTHTNNTNDVVENTSSPPLLCFFYFYTLNMISFPGIIHAFSSCIHPLNPNR